MRMSQINHLLKDNKTNNMENLAKAVINVMKSVKGMEKNSKVGTGKAQYDGTKYSDVAEVFNDALEANGLAILPISIEDETTIDRWEEEDEWSKSTPKGMKQKQSVFTKVKTKYLLLHNSGESVELSGYGHGIDPQDKGAGKATTYAFKNMLLYTFLTPVGKIDDSDNTHSNDLPVVPQKKTEQTNFEARDITLSEVKDKWNGRLYAGNALYIDNKKIIVSADQIKRLKANAKYKPDEKK